MMKYHRTTRGAVCKDGGLYFLSEKKHDIIAIDGKLLKIDFDLLGIELIAGTGDKVNNGTYGRSNRNKQIIQQGERKTALKFGGACRTFHRHDFNNMVFIAPELHHLITFAVVKIINENLSLRLIGFDSNLLLRAMPNGSAGVQAKSRCNRNTDKLSPFHYHNIKTRLRHYSCPPETCQSQNS